MIKRAYRDELNRWYWEVMDDNGIVVARCQQPFKTREACMKELLAIQEADLEQDNPNTNES